jgi:osmotically-inducible protein OsmY
MANRYDRDPDDYGFGRRDARDQSRDDDNREGQFAQGNRFGEGRQNTQSGGRNERDRNYQEYNPGRSDQDHRGSASGRDNTWRGSDNTWRGNNPSGNDYYSGRENSGRSDYYSSGRDYSSYNDRDRGSYGNYERGQLGNADRERNDSWRSDSRNDQQRRDRGDLRGIYQEQVWTRDPRSGNLYGYEYSSRIEPRRFNSGDESTDRWRTNVNDQNQRFDIDRGWHTPGSNAGGYGDTRTSGYGNAGNFRNSNYGKGPKGYTRSDERIREDVCDRLSDDDEIDARDITVTVKNAEVILEGSVNDRRSKHRAEDVAESVSGVKDVTNHLRARKGLLQELGDKISGDDDAEHHGHRGSGTRNSPTGGGATPQKTAH